MALSPRARRWVLFLFIAGAIWLGPYAFALGAFAVTSFSTGRVATTRTPSPDGHYDVVKRSYYRWLGVSSELWITDAGEDDSTKWHRLSPRVGRGWLVDWVGDRELRLSDRCGTPRPQDYGVTTWRDVRIEKCAPTSWECLDSPDGLHSILLWTQIDSRGRRMGALLRSSPKHPAPFPDFVLVEEGRWAVAAKWLANDHVQLSVVLHRRVPQPQIPAKWRAVRVSVAFRHP